MANLHHRQLELDLPSLALSLPYFLPSFLPCAPVQFPSSVSKCSISVKATDFFVARFVLHVGPLEATRWETNSMIAGSQKKGPQRRLTTIWRTESASAGVSPLSINRQRRHKTLSCCCCFVLFFYHYYSTFYSIIFLNISISKRQKYIQMSNT